MPERRKKKNLKVTRHHAARKTKVGAVPKKQAAAKKPRAASAAKTPPAAKTGALEVYDLNGKAVEKMELDPLFQDGPVNTDVIYQAVLMYQAGQREGTAATKTRGEVRGGGKKPWKQKGTGRARHASIRSPLWRGGGTTFGPSPRDYSYALPAQLRRKAVVEGVKDKVAGGKFVVLKQLELGQPKTRLMADILDAFKAEKPLVVVDQKSRNVSLASRNIPNLSVKTADEVNVLDVVSHKECMITRAGYQGLVKRLKS